MTETFTKNINSTTNTFEMKEQGTIENIETEESAFYTSICADLDLLIRSANADTIEKIMNHSKNMV